MFRSHEKILKPKRPSFSYPISNANKIPTTTTFSKLPPPVETEIDFLLDSDDDEIMFYDSMDHISDDEQAPDDDISDLLIKFKPFTIWNNSEDNPVDYILPPHYGKSLK